MMCSAANGIGCYSGMTERVAEGLRGEGEDFVMMLCFLCQGIRGSLSRSLLWRKVSER